MSNNQLTEAIRDVKQLVLSGCDIEAILVLDTITARLTKKEETPKG